MFDENASRELSLLTYDFWGNRPIHYKRTKKVSVLLPSIKVDKSNDQMHTPNRHMFRVQKENCPINRLKRVEHSELYKLNKRSYSTGKNHRRLFCKTPRADKASKISRILAAALNKRTHC